MALENANITERAEARLELLLEQNADVGPAWRDMVGGLQAEAGSLAVDAVAMATQPSVNELAVHGLSERFEALAERLEGVGLQDLGAQVGAAGRDLASGDASLLAQASEAALQSSQELSATAELSKSFDGSQTIAVAEASSFAEGAAASESTEYARGYRGNSLLDAIDKFREGAGMTPLREVSPLFRDIGEVAQELGEAWKSASERETPQGALESALDKLGEAKADLAAAQERLVSEGDNWATRDDVNGALARFNQAEAAVVGALDQVAAELNVEGVQLGTSGVSTAEATMTQFLEAGGTVTPDLVREMDNLDSLAGLTVRELDGLSSAGLDTETTRDVAGMLDNFAAQADSLGLTDMAEGLRDAAAATTEGPESVDLAAVKEFVGESAQTVSELRDATVAFSFGEAEFSNAPSHTGSAVEGLVASELDLDNGDFANLFQGGGSRSEMSGSKPEREAQVEMEMDR